MKENNKKTFLLNNSSILMNELSIMMEKTSSISLQNKYKSVHSALFTFVVHLSEFYNELKYDSYVSLLKGLVNEVSDDIRMSLNKEVKDLNLSSDDFDLEKVQIIRTKLSI